MTGNYTEILVREVLSEYIKYNEICECNVCREDIVRTVLNKLPPKYFLSFNSEGERKAFLLDKQLRLQALVEITAAVSQLCNTDK